MTELPTGRWKTPSTVGTYIRKGDTIYLTIPLNHVTEFSVRTGCMDEITKLPYPENIKER